MKLSFSTLAMTGALSIALMGSLASAHAQTVNSSDSGIYSYAGDHFSYNKNYLAYSGLYNDYFVFDLTGVSGPISSATFSAFNPSSGHGGGTDTFTLYDVSTAIPALEADQSGATSIYTDLGSGTAYGSVSVSDADNGQNVIVTLNNAALSYINANLGSSIAFGGSVDADYLFGFSGSVNPTLTLTAATPEPGSIALFVGMSVSGAGFLIRRHRNARKVT